MLFRLVAKNHLKLGPDSVFSGLIRWFATKISSYKFFFFSFRIFDEGGDRTLLRQCHNYVWWMSFSLDFRFAGAKGAGCFFPELKFRCCWLHESTSILNRRKFLIVCLFSILSDVECIPEKRGSHLKIFRIPLTYLSWNTMAFQRFPFIQVFSCL